ncbi:MAG: hypothetical protein JKY49_09435 [Cohaesibacteraceae bacterium]|nr:hypothetical protein [Cohaesibacteraceae bacterium]MBL4877087.1 hypothetical protein [Cohaesibacteraceae bacterium]
MQISIHSDDFRKGTAVVTMVVTTFPDQHASTAEFPTASMTIFEAE